MLVPPPIYLVSAAAAQRFLTTARPPSRLRRVAAAGISAASVTVAGRSASRFRRRGTTVDPTDPSQATTLVTDGVNAVTRNPMYVGMAGLLLAHAVARGSWTALLPATGFVLLVDRVQVAAEEAALTARFGEEYDAYRARVPRWVDARSWSPAGR